MNTADAIDLARRAIVHAAHRDAASGNIVRSMYNLISYLLNQNFYLFILSYEINWLGKNLRKRYERLYVSISTRKNNEFLNKLN
jgi:hypothetical protein